MYRFLPAVLLFSCLPVLGAQTGDDKKKGPPSLEGLKALQHADAKVRYRAADTLGQLGATAKFALPELREALKDKNAMVRVKVAEAIWRIEQPAPSVVMPTLLAALKDKDAGVRAAAPPVIAMLGTKAKNAVPALIEALGDKEMDVKLAAVAALGDLGPIAKDSANDLLALSQDKEFFLLEPFVGSSLATLGDGVVPALAQALGSKSADRRRVAAYALGSIGANAASATEELAQALKADDAATRKLSARALGKIGTKAQGVVPQLEKSLSDKDVSVRIESALAVWLVSGKATHVSVLVKALDDESIGVRETACQALGMMKAGAKDAVDPVARLLLDKDLRIRAIITLGEIGPAAKKQLPVLTVLLKDKDGEAQLWSAYACWQISGETKGSLPVLEELLGSEKYDKQAIHLITQMGPAAKDALSTLIAVYRAEEDPPFRQLVGIAIKTIDPPTAKKLGIK